MHLSGKVVLITGGASGIGKCCVEEFLKNDVKGVVIADINAELGEKVAQDFSKRFGNDRVIFVQTDVCDQNSFENAYQKTVDNYKNIDILVNNAGILDETRWEKEIEINLVATTRGCLLAINTYFPKYRSGSESYIINVASMAGVAPTISFPHYTSTKFGIVGLTRAYGMNKIIAREGICIMAICPGPTETPILLEPIEPRLAYPELFSQDMENSGAIQKPDAVAKSVIEILQKPENGTIWVINEDVLSKVSYPSLEEMLK